MPTSTEVKVRTLKGDRTMDLEGDQPGCFAFCRKLKFWRRRTRPRADDLEDEQLVTATAADNADRVSQLMPVAAAPAAVAENEGSGAALDQTQATGDLEEVPPVSDHAQATGELEGVPAAPDQAPVALEKNVSLTCRGRGLCRPCRLTVAVTRAQRRLVVGRRGDALRRLQQEYSGVRVTVPPPQDEKSDGVTLTGLRCQVEAAAQAIKNSLAEAEARQMQAKMARKQANKARKQRVKVSLAVAPNRRRHVVGHGGEALRAILQEYKEVRVTVPPQEDTKAEGITVIGPKEQVSAVTAAISRRLEEVEARLKEAKAAKKAKRVKMAHRQAKPMPRPLTLADYMPQVT